MEESRSVVYDACQHFVEPPDLWSKRLPAKLQAAAPKVAAQSGGGEAWSFGDVLRPLGLEVSAGQSPVDIRDSGYTYAVIRKGTYDPKARIKDMDIDEIDVANILPTFALALRHIKDAALQNACVSAYNDAVLEFCKTADPKRCIPQALMPHTNLDSATKELERVAKAGSFKGIVFNGWPAGGAIADRSEDAFWARVEEAKLVVNMVKGGPNVASLVPDEAVPVAGIPAPIEAHWAGRASAKGSNVAWLVYTNVLEKFPGLQVALLETGAGWLPFYLETVDDIYRRSRFWAGEYLKYTPREYFIRQVHATVEGDHFAIQARRDIGVKNLLWASCYPSAASGAIWPSSRVVIGDQFRGVPADERQRIVRDNAAELYGVKAEARAGQLLASGA